MKRALTLAACILAAHAACAADLMAVYQRALQNDPQLREAEANRLAALESKPQALSALLPQLSGTVMAMKERDTGPTNLVENVTVPGGASIVESFRSAERPSPTITSTESISSRIFSAGKIGWLSNERTLRWRRLRRIIKPLNRISLRASLSVTSMY